MLGHPGWHEESSLAQITKLSKWLKDQVTLGHDYFNSSRDVSVPGDTGAQLQSAASTPQEKLSVLENVLKGRLAVALFWSR